MGKGQGAAAGRAGERRVARGRMRAREEGRGGGELAGAVRGREEAGRAGERRGGGGGAGRGEEAAGE